MEDYLWIPKETWAQNLAAQHLLKQPRKRDKQ